MELTHEQLQIIRNATKDETAFEDVLTVFAEASIPKINNFFDLAPDQIHSIQAVIDALPISIYVKDTQGRFVMANQTTLNRHRLTSETTLIGKTDFDLMEHELAQKYYEMERTIIQTGEAVIEHEHCAEIKGDTRCYLISKSPLFDSRGTIIGIIGINQDITKRKIVLRELQDERNLLRTVIDHIDDKIYIKDLNSRFILANKSTLNLQGRQGTALDDLIGKTDFDFMPPERAQAMYEQEQQIMATGEAILNQELFTPNDVFQRGDMWFLVSKVPIKNEQGIITGLVGVNRDITNHVLARQRKIEVEVAREKSQFLATFINDSSHEFRTPLSVIRTAGYLLSKISDTSKHPRYIEQIMSQTKRLESLIGDLTLMISVDSATDIKRSVFQFNTIVNFLEAYAEHHQPADYNLTVKFENDNHSTTYRGDLSRLDQAFQRILDNALRYSRPDGHINLRVKSQAHAIVVTIEDDGIGMDDETMKGIFERFYRADTAHTISGFGLGLSIAQRIIELHGGTITVTSKLNIGSVFTVTLPHTE